MPKKTVVRLSRVVAPWFPCYRVLRNSWLLMVVDKMVGWRARPPSRWWDPAMPAVLLLALLAAAGAAPQYPALAGTPSNQRCSTVQEERCTTVDSVQCTTEEECSTVEESVCSTGSVQECRVVERQQCSTVQEEVRPTPPRTL